MLNNFCFHVYAQKSLFIAENCNGFFWTAPPYPLTLEFLELVPSQLKTVSKINPLNLLTCPKYSPSIMMSCSHWSYCATEPRHGRRSQRCWHRLDDTHALSDQYSFQSFQVFKFSSFQSFQVPSACLTFRHFFCMPHAQEVIVQVR